jgi:D-glycero-D-manno-heptose 1,7-bisphosphate phosphatase
MKLVILDRDGVINKDTSYRVLKPEQWEPINNSIEAIVKLKQAGHTVVIATNQSIIAKQQATLEDLEAIHGKMQQILSQYNCQIDQIFVCPHQSIDNCYCRKPKPGMLLEIENKYHIDFTTQVIPFVGDSIFDLLAGSQVGALPVLVKTGKGMQTVAAPETTHIKNLLIFDDLNAFVDYWLQVH